MTRYTVEATITVDSDNVDSGSEAVLYVEDRLLPDDAFEMVSLEVVDSE